MIELNYKNTCVWLLRLDYYCVMTDKTMKWYYNETIKTIDLVVLSGLENLANWMTVLKTALSCQPHVKVQGDM